jgi:hypothetical protein
MSGYVRLLTSFLSLLILTRHSGVRNPSCDRSFEGVASACKLLFSLRLSLPEQCQSDGRKFEDLFWTQKPAL